MSQLPVPGVRNVLGGLIGPYEKRKTKWQMALGRGSAWRLRAISLLGAAVLSLTAGVALMASGMASPAQGRELPPVVPSQRTVEEATDVLPDVGFNEWINVAAVLAVIWIALRTERLRRQSDDTGRFRRLHERMDDHSRRLAAHETRLQGLPTHKDLARIDARLVAVEHTMQQIAHSVTRMEDFLINGVAGNAAVMEMTNDT